jgi:hypothetical protein
MYGPRHVFCVKYVSERSMICQNMEVSSQKIVSELSKSVHQREHLKLENAVVPFILVQATACNADNVVASNGGISKHILFRSRLEEYCTNTNSRSICGHVEWPIEVRKTTQWQPTDPLLQQLKGFDHGILIVLPLLVVSSLACSSLVEFSLNKR